MELKKSEDANIEKLRMPIRMMGLLFIGSVVLASFSYTTEKASNKNDRGDKNIADINFMEEPQQEDTPPPPPPPAVDAPPPPAEELEIVPDTQEPPPPVVSTPPPVVVAPVEVVVAPAEIIDFPDVEAGFPGGAAAMQKWIANNVKYPQTAIEMNEQGRVYLSFVVEPDGSITGVKIERGVSPDLDKEAKRLVRKMPKWAPGEAKAKKVRTRCRLPINFTLN